MKKAKKTPKKLVTILSVISILVIVAIITTSAWYFSRPNPDAEPETEPEVCTKHEFNDGEVIKEPSLYEEGVLLKTCTLCGFQKETAIDKLKPTYIITVDGIGEILVSADGAYKLEDPEKVGFEFIKWVDDKGNEFSNEGTVSQSITVYPEFKLLDTKTVEELAERAEKGAEIIRIANDIVIDRPIFVTSTTKIYSDIPVKLIRAEGYLGDMFVIGQGSEGENSILMNLTPALILGNEDYTGNEILLSIDGNRDGMQEGAEVIGTALLLVNSARVDMYNGVSISNHQKLGNERILTISQYQLGTASTIGGAAAMISAGSAFYMHGGIMENNSARVVSLTLEDGTTANTSGYGGAIYNNGTFRMYGGTIKNCSANRGGAIYTDSVVEITGGILEGNYAENKGGALCSSGSAAQDSFIGVKDAEIGTVIFRNNSAGTQGGAILSYYDSTLLLFGGVLFEGNSALGSNGGAISTSGPITSYGNSFIGNTAKSGGGAIYQTYAGSDNILRIVELNGTTFEGNTANSGGAIYIVSQFNATDCIFTSNSAKSGGALYIVRPSVLTGCQFTENSASYRGGAIFVAYSEELKNILKATVIDSKFTSNKATEGGDNEERRGGAIYVGEYNIINVQGSKFEDNHATQYGGTISGARGAVINVSDSSIKGSSATNGGAIWSYSGTTLNLSGSEFANNSASKDGGAIYSYNAVNATSSTFNGNTAANGGALAVLSGTTSTIGCTFTSNTATNGGAVYVSAGMYLDGTPGVADSGSDFVSNKAYRGGAIYVSNDDEQTGKNKIFINHSSFNSNNATEGEDEKRRGGAIYLAEYVTATVNNSVFEENTASQYAGAIDVARGSKLLVNDSTFNKNTAGSNGGAIWLYSGSEISISRGSFTENSAGVSGGAIYSYNSASIQGATFSKNNAGSGGAIYVTGGSASISGAIFETNVANNYGGAVYVAENTVLIDGGSGKAGSAFKDNTATYGGAIYLATVEEPDKHPDRESGKATLEGSIFEGNNANTYGGAIYSATSTAATINNAAFSENIANRGSAVYINGGEFTVNNSVFSANVALTPEGKDITARGAAIFVQKGTVNATNVKFNDNTATSNGGAVVLNSEDAKAYLYNVEFNRNSSGGNGGAIWLYSGATVEITGIIAKGNKAEDGYGGFVYVTEGTLTIYSGEGVVNSFGGALENEGNLAKNGAVIGGAGSIIVDGASFIGNTATASGGALYIIGSAAFENCSFEGNTAATNGGAIYVNGTKLSLDNVSVTENNSGIYLYKGELEVSGRIIIKDNTNYDVYLPKGKLITVFGALDEESEIGFKISLENGDFALADGTNVTDLTDYLDNFFSNDGYPVFIGENGMLTCGFIIKEHPSVANEYTVTTIWQPDSYTWYTWEDGQRGEVVVGQTTATLTGGIDNQSYVCVLAYGDKSVETNPVTIKPAVVLQDHPICGGSCNCEDAIHESLKWYPVSDLAELISPAATEGNYYLTNDIVIDANIQITANVNICLNGKKLSRSGSEAFSMLTVAEEATLTLTDCGTEQRAGYIDPTTGLWTEGVYSGEESVIEYSLYGGLITNGAGAGGRAIYVYGTLNTYGINFAGNVGTSKGGALYAAGVYNDEGSTFVGNATSNQSGALEVAGGATLINTVFAYNRSTANRAGALLVTGNGINAYGVTFKNNVAYNGHGGAAIVTGAKTESVFDNCIFEGNLAVEGEDARAGAIYAHSSEPVITLSCQFIGNSADLGGAIYNTSSADYIDGKAGSSEFGSIFKDNTSIAAGGAIYSAGQVNLYGSKFENNVATTSGGAIYVYNNTNAINCTFTGNSATNDGGAVYVAAGKTYIDGEAIVTEGVVTGAANGSTYTENTAVNGGAICAEITKSTAAAGTIKLYGSTFTSNSASAYGGAVAVIGSAAEIYYCSFDSNTADKAGGSVAITALEYKVDGTTYRVPSTLTMVGGEVKNGTVDNSWTSSGSYGGGIIVYYGSQATIDGVVFDNNKAYSGGAITSYGSAKVKNGDEVTTVYTNVILNNVTVKNNDGQNGAIYVGGAGRMTVNGLVATDNTTKGSGAVFYLTSANSVLTINSATISGNKSGATHNDLTTGKLGFVTTANSANTLNIYKAGVTGADVNDNWDALITKGGASTVNELTAPTTEQ